ncbi:RHS repeat-associated core domain-containing protein [Paenibacillus gansuensis]|uniref:RHS repeat-associated core domain-containing protein n=1 Tax=Paenibacillus gansuensis TaxID=306542 RepID=A0ABW5PEV7_9BACL
MLLGSENAVLLPTSHYYDPRPARFISEDTYEGEIESPLTLNLYAYVSNNPLKFIDPSGHRQLEDKDLKKHPYVIFQVTTFIPFNRIPESGYIGLGDNRNLWEKGTHRTRHSVVVDVETGKIVGPKNAEAIASTIDIKLFKYVSSVPTTKGKLKAESSLKNGVIFIRMTGEIASEDLKWIPKLKNIHKSALTISYDFEVMLDASGNLKIPTLVGKHDGFPAYEVLVIPPSGIAYGYSYDPRQTGNSVTRDNILSLLDPMEKSTSGKMSCVDISHYG